MAGVSETTNRVMHRYTDIGTFVDIGTLGRVATDSRTGMLWEAPERDQHLGRRGRREQFAGRRLAVQDLAPRASLSAVDDVSATVPVRTARASLLCRGNSRLNDCSAKGQPRHLLGCRAWSLETAAAGQASRSW